MNYFTFGMSKLRVTQNYNGTTSHKLHWYKAEKFCDYPIDIAGLDSSREPYYAPVDMKVTAIKGIGNSTTNTIWLVATERCSTPSGIMTPFIMLTHWNDDDPYIKNLKVDSIVQKGQPICEEGKDGTTANHLHMVCGNADKGCGNGLIKNGNSFELINNIDTIVYTSPEFQPCSKTFSDKYVFVGPSIRPVENVIEKKSDKLIYISMGTVINDSVKFYKKCIEAFANTKYQVIMSVGNLINVEDLGAIPDNITISRFVDQIAVLSQADVFLTHCGMNSVNESLYYKVPLVMFPQTSEQDGVATRVLLIS